MTGGNTGNTDEMANGNTNNIAAGNTGKTYVMANGNTTATFGNTSNIAGNIRTAAANVDNTDAKAAGNIHILSKFNFSIR